jgi:hypothetical protein
MKCPKCQTDNPEDKKFCRECGADLVYLCPQCGAEVLPSDKFCGDCRQPKVGLCPTISAYVFVILSKAKNLVLGA